MSAIDLKLAGDWTDLEALKEEGRVLINPTGGIKVVVNETAAGPRVALRIDTGLAFGPAVVVEEISLRELLVVVDAIKSAYGDPRG